MADIIRHLKSILPIPRKWDEEERAFAGRIEDAYRMIQIQLRAMQNIQNAYVLGKDMPTGTDLDDIKTEGSYWFSATAAAGADNAPSSSAFHLLVIVRRKTDSAIAFDQIAIASNKVFIRVTSGSGWSSWKEYDPV